MNKDCTKNAQKPIKVGKYTFRNNVLLAPMSGVTDVPFRKLAWKYGAGMVVSEMVASEALTTGQEEMRLKSESAGLPVHMVQLAGRQPKWMAEATRIALGSGADIIDINMGCPSKRVTNGYSGSALMRDLDHALTLIDAVVETSDVPVTLKMRLGWDMQSINAPELARRAQDAGVQLITVHGRTRDQFYKGQANWNLVQTVRNQTELPLIVNGDITSADDARAAMSASGADAVMVGRATYGSPWLCGQIAAELMGETGFDVPKGSALGALVGAHHEEILSLYGFELGIRNARKHLDWYLAHLEQGQDVAAIRLQMMKSRDPKEIQNLIQEVFGGDYAGKKAA